MTLDKDGYPKVCEICGERIKSDMEAVFLFSWVPPNVKTASAKHTWCCYPKVKHHMETHVA